MASANDFVMSCGLVIAEPTTAQNAPNSKTLFNFSGVLIFPSAITGCFTLERIVHKISKSFSSILRLLLCFVYPTIVVPIKSNPNSSA